MPHQQQQLQRSLRQSDTLTQDDIFRAFLLQANSVSDQQAVLLYMQEHQIGTYHMDYWLARMDVLLRQCEYCELVRMIHEVSRMREIEEAHKLEYFKNRLMKKMEGMLYGKLRLGKRHPDQYFRNLDSIHPEYRMVGGIKIWVDQTNRKNYKMEDYAVAIQRDLKDLISIEREDYRRGQQRKPLSQISQNRQKFLELTQQLNKQPGRRSTTGPNQRRFSAKINTPNQDGMVTPTREETKITPKKNQTSTSLVNKKESRRHDSSRDSVEILKSIQKVRGNKKQKEIKKQYKEEDFLDDDGMLSPRFHPASSYKHSHSPPQIQRCRSSIMPQSQENFLTFSFGRKDGPSSAARKQLDKQNKDFAFIFASFSKESKQKDKDNNQRDDFELGLIINEIQRQTYEIDTKVGSLSEIDSNQQNKGYEINVRGQRQQGQRIPFGVVYESPRNSIGLEQLMNYDSDELIEQQMRVIVSNNTSFRSEQKPRSHLKQESVCFSEHKSSQNHY